MSKLAIVLCATFVLTGLSAAWAQEGGASISGTIKLDGPVKRKKLNSQLDSDKYCGPQRGDQDVLSEDVITGANNELANVFVWVKKGIKGKYNPPDTKVEIDQNKCIYHPHVIALMVGQPFVIKNSDDTMHNIHGLGKLNGEFNEGQGSKGMTSEKKFSVREIGVKIKCDVHPWMGAWLHVVDHPFFAVSKADGTYKIDKLPAGTYEIEFWHEKYANGKETKTVTKSVTVGDKEAKTEDHTFQAK
jgi:plastocyanin